MFGGKSSDVFIGKCGSFCVKLPYFSMWDSRCRIADSVYLEDLPPLKLRSLRGVALCWVRPERELVETFPPRLLLFRLLLLGR